ncbi:MAG TPA: hypothetical protein DCS93_00630 [Microscillaceae bacterium]|nr:hypothetical protein [Microscillaceae bacterium]
MKKVFICLGVLFYLVPFAQAQLSKAQLLADLSQLVQLIDTKHVRPYRLVSKQDFDSVVKQAKKLIKSRQTCDETCYVAFLKVIAALNDGHSVIAYDSREKLFGYLPVTTTWFKEGLIVTRVPQLQARALGKKLVAIDGVSIETVLKKLEKVIPHGNRSRFKKFAYAYLRMPGLLFGLGITQSPQKATFTFAQGKKKFRMLFEHLPDEKYKRTKFVRVDDYLKRVPIHRQKVGDYYWYRYDAALKVFYFNYSRVGNMKNKRASAFARQMWAKVDSLEIDRFVLDMRDNGGGQFGYSMAFTQGILDRPRLNKRGKLFVIAGYNTFSAALDMLRIFEQKTQAIIVGEPPCDYAASSGDPKTYKLNNSGISVQLSSVFHPTVFKNDMRKELILDQQIASSWASYSKGRDDSYEYVLNYVQKPLLPGNAKQYQACLGRFEYDEDRHIIIRKDKGALSIEVSKTLISPLYWQKKNRFITEIQGLRVELNDKNIKLYFPDGKKATFKRAKVQKSALEYLYEGDLAKARPLYSKLAAENPRSPKTTDGRFSNLALFAFFDLRKTDKAKAAKIAKGILNLGIELNQGQAPSCKFALRFY